MSHFQVKSLLVNNNQLLITKIAVRCKVSSSNSSDRACMAGRRGRVRISQHVEIIAIYRRHRYYRAFPGPTATRCCSCRFRLRRCDELVERMRSETTPAECASTATTHAACVSRSRRRSTACCAAGAHVVRTSEKSPSGRSPRARTRKQSAAAAARSLHEVHKRLMLEPSESPVCNCSELLRRLQTTMNEPPPPCHIPNLESGSSFSIRSNIIHLTPSTTSYQRKLIIVTVLALGLITLNLHTLMIIGILLIACSFTHIIFAKVVFCVISVVTDSLTD